MTTRHTPTTRKDANAKARWANKASGLLRKALDPVVEAAERHAFFDKVCEIVRVHGLDLPVFAEDVQPTAAEIAAARAARAAADARPRRATERRCAHCGRYLPNAATTGRPRMFCNDAHRTAAYRKRRA